MTLEEAREAATLRAHDVLKAAFEPGGARPVKEITAEIIDAFLAKLGETHAIVERAPLVKKLGIALAQQGHSMSADSTVTYEDEEGHEHSAPYWLFHEYDKEAEFIIDSLAAKPSTA